MDPTKLLEEEEREWRTSDSYWGPTAKHNAAMVANILRWGNFQKNPHSGFRQHLRFLEEKERSYRIGNTELAMQNAYNESRLIKYMGPPFYVQEDLGKGMPFFFFFFPPSPFPFFPSYLFNFKLLVLS
jgi:hypothetical protein